MLAFLNLAEVHVLAAITRDHDVPLQRVRRAVKYLERVFGTAHPLVEKAFETDGQDLFVREAERLINASRDGQTAIREALDLYLARIEWDEAGLAARLFPFTGKAVLDAPRAVVIDPRIAFGKPVLVGTSIPTQIERPARHPARGVAPRRRLRRRLRLAPRAAGPLALADATV